MPVLLVRHAHAGSREEWHGEDAERPLSKKGRRQADSLVGMLESHAPQRILSSPFVRCVQTVQPLADRLGVTVEVAEELAEGNGPAAVALVRSLADEKVALCTHGDVIPDVLVALADEDRVDLGPRPRQAKGSVWVLETDGGHFVRAAYLPPAGG
ncbi:MAG TPA: phosphoglycerate mutase family protein [Acidimicrobiales bacterium]|nr:phosphoglycerate mutase family protein [Acidimicrobiales bacterium]